MKLKSVENQIAHGVHEREVIIQNGFGNLMKWMPIMSRHGVKVELQIFQIARCYVRHTIEQKEINNIISFNRH